MTERAPATTSGRFHDDGRRLRVALVHYRDDASAGGSLRVGEALARNLDRSRIEPQLVFAYGGKGAISRNFNGSAAFLRAAGPADPGAWIRARKFFSVTAYDVVHFVEPVNWLRLIVSGTAGKKVIHVHGRFFPDRMTLRNRLLNRLTVAGADARVCVTHGALESLKELGWTGNGKSFVVHNGVDCNYFAPKGGGAAFRERLGLPQDSLVMGMVCRLVKHRGVQDGLRLLASLPSRWRLVICGDGPYKSALQAEAESLGVMGQTRFTGLLDDVRPAFACMDAFLLLARYDTFGIATAEAMASGVPVFGLEGEGEYREPEYPLITSTNAVLIPRRNKADYDEDEPEEVIAALANQLRVLETSRDAFAPMRDEARSWVATRFSVERQARLLAEIYETVAVS